MDQSGGDFLSENRREAPSLGSAAACGEPSGMLLEGCLAAFGQVRLRVTGSCMGRALPAGTGVVVAGRSVRQPRLGDIVLVRQRGGLRLHRLIWISPGSSRGTWRTKGDLNASWDPRIAADAVIGTVVAADAPLETFGPRVRRTAASLAAAVFRRVASRIPRMVS
jgi:hypothetical protein